MIMSEEISLVETKRIEAGNLYSLIGKAQELLRKKGISKEQDDKLTALLPQVKDILTELKFDHLGFELDFSVNVDIDVILSFITIFSLFIERLNKGIISRDEVKKSVAKLVAQLFDIETDIDSASLREVNEKQQQHSRLRFKSRVFSWCWLLWDQDPQLRSLLPTRTKAQLITSRPFDEIILSMSSYEQDNFILQAFDYLVSKPSQDNIVKFPFTTEQYIQRLSSMYELLKVPDEERDFDGAIIFYKRGVIVVYKDTSLQSTAHEKQHRDFPGVRIGSFIGEGLDETITDYKARRAIETLTLVYRIWYLYKEEWFSRLKYGSAIEQLILQFVQPLGYPLLIPAVIDLFRETLKQKSITKGLHTSVERKFDTYDNKIVILKRIFKMFPILKPLMIGKYESGLTTITEEYWVGLINTLGLEEVGALYSWEHQNNAGYETFDNEVFERARARYEETKKPSK
ncbi:MAG TPA: hypothetical protein VD999_01900 [Vitreimonas sp.]|nr:hypothetical protein [Vitreimonas sp.]